MAGTLLGYRHLWVHCDMPRIPPVNQGLTISLKLIIRDQSTRWRAPGHSHSSSDFSGNTSVMKDYCTWLPQKRLDEIHYHLGAFLGVFRTSGRLGVWDILPDYTDTPRDWAAFGHRLTQVPYYSVRIHPTANSRQPVNSMWQYKISTATTTRLKLHIVNGIHSGSHICSA